jgi:aspartate-semialdehyde dehydrogenase
MVSALAPLEAAFGLEAVLLSSMQAASGAGYPGVPSLDLMGNVIPFIRDEEQKVAEETRKVLGRFAGDSVILSPMRVSAACHRVPVADGHTEAVSVKLRAPARVEEIRAAFANWPAEANRLHLPSAPATVLLPHQAEDRPQPRLDLDEDGMIVHVGRVRPCEVLDFKFTVFGHNAERGAAGASVLNAELVRALGRL